MDGYYPIYHEQLDANNHVGGNGTSNVVTITSKDYYMPNGVTQYLGTYDDPIEVDGYYPLYNLEIFAINIGKDNLKKSFQFLVAIKFQLFNFFIT